MSFSPSDMQNAIDHLATNGVDSCPACKREETLAILGHPVALVPIREKTLHVPSTIPIVAVYCQTCFHTMLFPANRMGIETRSASSAETN